MKTNQFKAGIEHISNLLPTTVALLLNESISDFYFFLEVANAFN
jgi:hypothetical protein